MYLNIDNIKCINIDHTSRCNLACPQCSRTNNNKLPILDLSLDDYKIMLEPFEGKDLLLWHCGNYGDVLASPTFDETLDYCLSKNFKIHITTNGSLRKKEWWTELAQKSKKIKVKFSIDGLKDTNHIYRVRSNFDKIIENARAFIDAGGNAEWAFIEFQHNQHQIKQAERMAKILGFKKFSVKYTVRGKNRNTEEKKKFNSQIFNNTISCKYKLRKTIFVDMNMQVWPCCWTATTPYVEANSDLKNICNKYGHNFNNLRIYGWNVLNHEFFQSFLEDSWNNNERLYVCGKMCAKNIETSSAHGNNQITKEIN